MTNQLLADQNLLAIGIRYLLESDQLSYLFSIDEDFIPEKKKQQQQSRLSKKAFIILHVHVFVN